MASMKSFSVAAVCFLFVSILITRAADIAGSQDHPEVKRFQGSEIFFFKTNDFDELRLALSKIEWSGAEALVKPFESKTVEGKSMKMYYSVPDGPSVLEVFRNYENELKAHGFEILFSARAEDLETRGYNNQIATEIFRISKPYGTPEESADWLLSVSDDSQNAYLVGRKLREDGGETYVSVYVFLNAQAGDHFFGGVASNRVVARVDIVEVKGMEQRMELVTASKMQDEMSTSGRVALYGIHFDFNKTDLKPESIPTLEQIAALLREQPSLRLLVVGHTDNVGGFEFNRDLSHRRAAAVVERLKSGYGISPERLFPFGVSYASPMTSNDSDEGRAKNRRVELVEFNK